MCLSVGKVMDRIRELADVFAIGVYAYAVMSNHMHVVVKLEPGVAWSWPREEVARRWVALFPVREAGETDVEATARRAEVIAGDLERVSPSRERGPTAASARRARRFNRDRCTSGTVAPVDWSA